jgi:hypothetical protein
MQMRFASLTSFSLVIVAALVGAAACSGDDDVNNGGSAGTAGKNGSAGTAGKNGSAGTSSGEAGAPAGEDSRLCTDLGGPRNIDAVVRGDGETSSSDPFNGFKFEKDGRQASVLLNAATDPCIGQQFAHLLAPAKAADLEHFAQCLSLFVQNAAGCAVAYDQDSAGKACQSMAAAHAGLGITEEDYTALINDAAAALIAAGVDPQSEQFAAVAGALTADSLKADVITSDSADYSQPGEMCGVDGEGMAGAGASGAGTGGAPSGEAGMGGAR